jgi:iron(III) transport system ATP-binding protein
VPAGDLFALLGPSGSGKTTLLRVLAGFERPDGGELRLFGELVAGRRRFVPPERRGVGMVFQDYALFPHMSVAANVAYGLRRSALRETRVREVLSLVGLRGLGARGVHELSGGEQQRVALARALAPGPRLLLLDEPFSNLDAALRVHVRSEVRAIVKQVGATAILVTHDQEEALSVADRVGFLWRGRVEQVAPPDQLYTQPATLHVAAAVGDANLLRATASDGHVQTPLGRFPAPPGATRCVVVVRPEDLQSQPAGVAGTIVGREYYGHDQVLHVRLAQGTELRVRAGPYERPFAGGPISLGLRRDPVVLPDEE